MCTLVEIFDAKQYENIITPVNLNIKKLIYVGTKEVMTEEKAENIKRFFSQLKLDFPIDFFYVERDNEQSIKNRLTQIVQNNRDVVFDATGGEDVILTNVGVISERFSVPVIRVDVETKKCTFVHGEAKELSFRNSPVSIRDLITLQGGQILSHDSVDSFTDNDVETLRTIFEINGEDCEAYSAFCNKISEYLSYDQKRLVIIKSEFNEAASRLRFDISSVLESFIQKGLLKKEDEDKKTITYKVKSPIVSLCLKKSGNVLEYYTAVAASSLDFLSDIKVGVHIEWDINSKYYETQNEIDVMAVSNSHPVFISCKNGEVRKDALYELDSVARALGGSYAKKVLVCTFLTKSKLSKEKLLERASDMGIKVVFNTHSITFEKFSTFLKKATS